MIGVGGVLQYVRNASSDPAVLPNTLVVEGTGEEVQTTYRFDVTGEVRRSGALGSLDDAETVARSAAAGSVWGDGVDGYRFSGEIVDVTADGPANLYLNDRRVDPDDVGSRESALPNTLVVRGTGEEVQTRYRFDVTGEVDRSALLGSLDGAETVARSAAAGSVWGPGVDGYRFSGDVVDVTTDGPAEVFVNDRRVDPAEVGTDPDAPRELLVRGTGEEVTSPYVISVSGELERSALLGSLNDGDAVGDGSAEGSVWGSGVDGYRFSGDVEDATIDGPAELVVDGRQVDPDEVSSGDGSGDFAPAVDVQCYDTSVRADTLRRVRLHMGDGSTVEFEGTYDGGGVFGYAGAGAVTPDDDHTFSTFRNAIERVEVSDGESVEEFESQQFPCLDLSFDVSSVTAENEAGHDVRTTFADGTIKRYDVSYDAPHTYGSPGRRLVRADFVSTDLSVDNPVEGSPESSPAVTFDGDAVTIGREEFVDVEPRFREVRLAFTDGTAQTFTSGASDGPNGFTAPETFRGTDEREGKTVERVHLYRSDGAPRTVYFQFPNPAQG